MFSISESELSLEFVFSSQMQLVDRVVSEARKFVQKSDGVNSTQLEHVLRELLINAIEHGNKGDAQKKVSCAIESMGTDRYQISVQDEGHGFDLTSLPTANTDDPQQMRSRGYTIINMYADEIRPGHKGGICVYMTLPRELLFSTSKTTEEITIAPSGDLSASIAENFRKALLQALVDAPPSLCVNLQHVRNIDSICLSILALLSKSAIKDGKPIRLRMANASVEIRDLMRLTRLDHVYRLSGEAKE